MGKAHHAKGDSLCDGEDCEEDKVDWKTPSIKISLTPFQYLLLTYTLSVLMQTMGNMTTRDTPRPVHSSHMFSRTKALRENKL